MFVHCVLFQCLDYIQIRDLILKTEKNLPKDVEISRKGVPTTPLPVCVTIFSLPVVRLIREGALYPTPLVTLLLSISNLLFFFAT